MTTIPVIAGADRYDVLVGPLADARDRLPQDAIIISESNVLALHAKRLAPLINLVDPILLPAGEEAKSWHVLHHLLGEFAHRGASRTTHVIALGGGSIGDTVGLATSLFKRGCPVIHIPTTLLSQADSAVGGKTAIDAFGEKNVIGTFHQPSLVVADPAFLDTLDDRQMRSGYAEIVKYGLIDDPAFFAWCETNAPALLAGDPAARHHAITTAITAKARMIAGDVEDRSGRRALLNLGHSFAHAIESEAGLGTLLHGEAVAIGMVLAFRFSAHLGLCPAQDADQVARHLAGTGLLTTLAEIDLPAPSLLPWIARDKKNEGAALTLILTRGIGRAFTARDVDQTELANFLAT